MADGSIEGLSASVPAAPVESEGGPVAPVSGAREREPEATASGLATARAATGASLGMGSAPSPSAGVSGSASEPRISVLRGRELREAGPVDGTRVGTLHVGDRFASLAQNSKETVDAAGPNTPGRASLSISVAGAERGESPRPRPEARTPEAPSESGSDSGSGTSLEGETRRRRRRRDPGAHSLHTSLGSPVSPSAISPGNPGSSVSAVPPGGSTPGASSPSLQRFVFAVSDVHNMGGRPSSLSIRNTGTGEMVSSIPLQPGDSRIVADLPPGDYSVEAISGSRPGSAPSAGADNMDNFRVDVFSLGSLGGGGGDAGLGSIGGGVGGPSS